MAYTTINKSTDYFNTKLYTGNGSTQSITGVGFQPDLTWLKARSESEYNFLYDAIRGATKGLSSDLTAAEATYSDGLTAFASDGFTLGSSNGINRSGTTYASWNWKANGAGSSNTDGSITSTVSANTTAGFSIVSYTGTGANATVGHGLGVAPKVVLVKNRDGIDVWVMQHGSLADNEFLEFNGIAAKQTDSARFNGTAPTSTVFSVGTSGTTNGNTEKFIAYCFAEKPGYSKFGSWIGNGNADGTFVYTGFKPEFVILKNASGTNQWLMFDNAREPGNVMGTYLEPNSSAAEANFDGFDFLSNGMKMRTSNSAWNTSGSTYIYIAFGQSLVGSNNVPCTAR